MGEQDQGGAADRARERASGRSVEGSRPGRGCIPKGQLPHLAVAARGPREGRPVNRNPEVPPEEPRSFEDRYPSPKGSQPQPDVGRGVVRRARVMTPPGPVPNQGSARSRPRTPGRGRPRNVGGALTRQKTDFQTRTRRANVGPPHNATGWSSRTSPHASATASR